MKFRFSNLFCFLTATAGILLPVQGFAETDSDANPGQLIQLAQQAPPGRVRIQGRDEQQETAPAPRVVASDYRETMRQFVQSISDYARKQKRGFFVVAKDSLNLVIKRNPVDQKVIFPARTFMRSIDGVLVDGLFYGRPLFGQPTDKKILEPILPLANRAINNGLKVMVIDYVKSPREVDESLKMNSSRGFVPFAANTPRNILNTIPQYPRIPFQENSKSILSLKDVRNFLYLRETSRFGRQDEFALQLHNTNFDLVVVDVFHGRDPLSRRAVETLKFKKVGGRRLVFAHVSIGTAASYHYYWKPRWREGSPFWIKAPVPGDPVRYYIEFWQPEWKRIISGNPKSAIFGVIRQGYDGVILEGLDAFQFFEGSGTDGGATAGAGRGTPFR